MTLLQARVFLAIARSGSITKAGDQLNLTQSAVSQHLASLESELGLTLFHRSKSGVSLTDAGQTLLPFARELLQGEEQLQQAAAAIRGVQIGALTIGCFPSFMAAHMPRLIKGFKDLYPGIDIEFREGNYEEIAGWLLEGSIDVGFNVFAEAPLQFTPLMEEPLVAVIPHDHSLKELAEVPVDQLLNEPFIRDTGCERFLERLFPDPARQPPYQFGVRDTFAILAMVQSGLGITVLPKMSVPDGMPGIRTCELMPRLLRTIGLSSHSRRPLSPGASAFMQYIFRLHGK
ncbi:LysR family transcriptional regulator [Cohnella lubricantis]|uniref:LysR family transcriptional regulator n=1 Tax=Cohnella lubricantis TaxID=2163172 RepID=A0A841T775_9BACL|nr:LysR family transcriptional regulator [Cohnella lubricantis]MBB6676742.1 LysR family transcriptional regulator [Cohnella lubricantis]MBP2117788.1 DNA-binding transcriptional LysR family regulator [Cohnella lubricantis]